MASSTLLKENESFRWNCPYLNCEETFEHAWNRYDHLKSSHTKDKQPPKTKSETSKEVSPSAFDASNFAIPKNFNFDLNAPIHAVAPSDDRGETKDNSNVNIDTPEETCMSSMKEPRRPAQTYILFEGWDFTVVLGSEEEGEVEILVSSGSLLVSCVAWNKLLSEGYREFVEKKAKFPEDDADTMFLLLQIAHFKFNKVPAKMDLEELWHIAVVCEKYDLTILIQPWLEKWMEQHRLSSNLSRSNSLLTIFWVFGDAENFERISKSMVYLGACEKDDGILKVPGSPSFDRIFRVPQIIESILEAREKTIMALFHLCDTYIRELLQNSKCAICAGPLCNALGLGTLLQGLNQIGIWPEKQIEQYINSKTVQDLHQSLIAIKFFEIPLIRNPQKQCTGILKRDFVKEANRICNSISPVLPLHSQRLMERNQLLGIFPKKSVA